MLLRSSAAFLVLTPFVISAAEANDKHVTLSVPELQEFAWMIGEYRNSGARPEGWEGESISLQPSTDARSIRVVQLLDDKLVRVGYITLRQSKVTLVLGARNSRSVGGYHSAEFVIERDPIKKSTWSYKGRFPSPFSIECEPREGTRVDLVLSQGAGGSIELHDRNGRLAVRLEKVDSVVGKQVPVVDGILSEWGGFDKVVMDPKGDATGAFDILGVSPRIIGAQLFLRLRIDRPLNLQNGQANDGTLVLKVGLPRERTLSIDFRGRKAILETTDTASTIPWSEIRFVSLPTYAAKDFEMRVDLAKFGVEATDQLRVAFDGSDALDGPILVAVNNREATLSNLPKTDRVPGTIRIASVNTLRSGLADEQRAKGFEKLLAFADADIYCFNEEWEEDKFRDHVEDVIGANAANLHWKDGCAIATKHRLTAIPMDLQRGAAALIEVPDHQPIVVVSVHFKCCGYAGSDEDKKRISEANRLVAELAKMRKGAFGQEAAKAGVVVIGDYNLVGSRWPLEILNEAGLKDFLLRSPVDGNAATWQGLRPTESFWPGRLDYVTYDTSRIAVKGGYKVSGSELQTMRPNVVLPSNLSDHSMLVVDVSETQEKGPFENEPTSLVGELRKPGPATAPAALSDRLLTRGEKQFNSYCAACHQLGGQGVEGRVPPLDDSPWVAGSEERLVRIVLNGLKGPIEIHGKTYNLEMPSFRQLFKDDDIASLLSYVRKRYGKPSPPITSETVSRIRKDTNERIGYWTVAELLEIR